jgi:transcription initiation factor IIE alpha subunit
MAESDKPTDVGRDRLLSLADEALKDLAKRGIAGMVHFKFTCEHCGERCTFEEPNLLFEYGDCDSCGKRTHVQKGGFMVNIVLDDKVGA